MITHPDQARALLVAHPQLAYALFQALLLNKIVDPAILQVQQFSGLASHPAQLFRSLFSACLQPRIQATLLVLPLPPLRPRPHCIWHQHLRPYHSSLRPACTHRTMGLRPRRSRHPSTLHKSQCTLHPYHHRSSSSNNNSSNSSTCHTMVFHSSHRNRRLRQHQRLLSTASTHRRRYFPILPPKM